METDRSTDGGAAIWLHQRKRFCTLCQCTFDSRVCPKAHANYRYRAVPSSDDDDSGATVGDDAANANWPYRTTKGVLGFPPPYGVRQSDIATVQRVAIAAARRGTTRIRNQVELLRNARTETVCKSQSCMFSKVRMIWKPGRAACPPHTCRGRRRRRLRAPPPATVTAPARRRPSRCRSVGRRRET